MSRLTQLAEGQRWLLGIVGREDYEHPGDPVRTREQLQKALDTPSPYGRQPDGSFVLCGGGSPTFDALYDALVDLIQSGDIHWPTVLAVTQEEEPEP